jgi:2-polyprenyl-3-methyl-5-hydroxy-6-metoxy-1,4-benzoquinol methylase
MHIQERIDKSNNIEKTLRKLFIEKISSIVKDKKDLKVLSVSTGGGVWDYVLFSNFKNIKSIVATDIIDLPVNQQDVDLLKRLGNWEYVKVDPEDKLPFSNEEFDIVMHHDVLEHVKKPQFFLEEQHGVLKKGGHLVFETPNLLRPMNILRMLAGKLDFPRKIGFKEEIGDYIHIQEFTQWQLKTMLQEVGFTDVSFTYSFLGLPGIKIADSPSFRSGKIFCHDFLVSSTK